MEEVWKNVSVSGFEDLYQVSNLGNVRSVDRMRGNRFFQGKRMKPNLNKQGYCRVTLSNCEKTRKFFVHVLVINAFKKNVDNLSQINHIDENKQNNCLENLEYCSASYNVNYGQGKWKATKKRTKLLSKKVICIETGQVFENAKEASNNNESLRRHICDVCNGNRRTAGGFHWMYFK